MDLPFALIYLALVGMLGGKLVIVPSLILAIFAFSAVRIGNKLRGAIQSRMVSDDRRFNFLIEVLGGIHTVKAMAMEAQMVRRYERLQENCAQANHDVALESSGALSISAFFNQITMLAVVAFGSLIVMDGNMTTGGLAACSMLAGRAMTPLQKALSVWTRFQTFVLARKRIEELFALPFEAKPGLPAIPKVNGGITLDDVSFRFAEQYALGDPPRQHHRRTRRMHRHQRRQRQRQNDAAGHDARHFAPDGRAVDDRWLGRQRFRSQKRAREHRPFAANGGAVSGHHSSKFDHVPLQSWTMWPSKPHHCLGLDEVVATMAFGFDTPVADGAYDSLPRGIKQRIAITRALVSNPKIVLFDEANASMDTAGDNFLRVWLERSKNKRTLILVTPRPSLQKLADRVFDLKDGALIERKRDNDPLPPLTMVSP